MDCAALTELHADREGSAPASALRRRRSCDDATDLELPLVSILDLPKAMRRASSSSTSRLKPEWLPELDIAPYRIGIGENGAREESE